MDRTLLVGTRKGLFAFVRDGGWRLAETRFLGDPVSAVLPLADGGVLAALDLGHFGVKLWRRDAAGSWDEIPAPAFPPKPDEAGDDPHPWTVGKIWTLVEGGDGRIWAGTIPGGLFVAARAGAPWVLVDALWRHPQRRAWIGGGYDHPGLHSLLVHPADPDVLTAGISTGGVWHSRDGGASWRLEGDGLYAEYMPPERRHDRIVQDVHRLAACRARPEVVWCQHHNGMFRSTDGGVTFQALDAIVPAKFGFAVAAHPHDPLTAWFVPAIKDEKRIPVDARVVVARTRDGGASFEAIADGLPAPAYDLVWRHGLAVDGDGAALAMGSTSGGLWTSDDGGTRWTMAGIRLPPAIALAFRGPAWTASSS